MNQRNTAQPASALNPERPKALAQNIAPQRLHFVPLRDCPCLTAPAARIMSESSPMYAIVEDCVPPKHHAACSNFFANLRLKKVREQLTVVLRGEKDLSEGTIDHALDTLRSKAPTAPPRNPRLAPLQSGPLEVVGIYTLIPPSADGQSGKVGATYGGTKVNKGDPERPLSLWARVRNTVSGFLQRIGYQLTFLSCIRWGLQVPSLIFRWIGSFEEVSTAVAACDIYDPCQHKLETMCIASSLRGQGVGGAVMKHIQAELSQSGAKGVHGLCQSQRTNAFYVKCGFESREVYTLPHVSPYKPGEARKHYLVTWTVSGRGAMKGGEGQPGEEPGTVKNMACL